VIAPDSSVVIAALAPWHESHRMARDVLTADDARLPAHVAFETTSALSRMPEGRRIAPAVVLDALKRGFKEQWLALDAGGSRKALQQAVAAGVRGGALYDALIAATAAAHGAQIVSADHRAQATYAAMAAEVRFIDVV
jgi:predicted nucleic acid-binding protein